MKNPVYIYVCREGFVIVGRPRPQRAGDDYMTLVLDDCAVVRRWGTTRGLGQLALDGPQPSTVFDPEPAGVELTRADIKRAIPCAGKGWEKWTALTR